MRRPVLRFRVSASLITVLFCGCASSTALFHDPSLLVKDPGSLVGRPRIEKNVARVVPLWEATTGQGVDGKNARGFTGQILFFGSGCETGARVHGKVNIYVYDNFDPDSLDDPELLHTFSFEPDAWEVHRAEGTFGHSYCVFVPYTNQHRNQVHCGLKVEIVLDDGRTISSRPTDVLLPGQHGGSETVGPTRGFVRHKKFGADIEAMTGKPYFGEALPHPAPRKLDTLSIPLPKR